ncbi:MAG: hypothetical protein B6D68_04110 [spirochete symbiont of Stewartia floridana]|nr:MAG: hypothetical protein B6D68_04110 [spirochete symbiont of Stewartia floridana]
MPSFVDEIQVTVFSGDGGAGSASFRREKYIPRGGPDGGDGGMGGSVIFETRLNLFTLSHLSGKTIFKAGRGENGRGRRMHGRNGEDILIHVPPGTHISDGDSGELLHDFKHKTEGDRWICLFGGKGGLGNWHFRSSRNQSPQYAQKGLPGSSRFLTLDLSLIANIGLIGLPSAGKSSLINAITAAKSKIGAYPFTTKAPQLGVLIRRNREVIIADLPGLILGASKGLGMGHRFLRHIARTESLAILTDLGEDDPAAAVHILDTELRTYDESMSSKRRIIIGTKTDLDPDGHSFKKLKAAFPDDEVYGISVYSRDGFDDFLDALIR